MTEKPAVPPARVEAEIEAQRQQQNDTTYVAAIRAWFRKTDPR